MSIQEQIAELSEIRIEPLTGRIGAEVRGVHLSGRLSPALVEDIRQQLYRYKVLFFRGQDDLDEAGQEGFGSLFGELTPHPTIPSLEGTEYILDVDSGKGARATSWHTDMTFMQTYPQISVLRALVVPEYGGDTIWANTAAAYSTLAEPLRELAERLWALHTNVSDYAAPRADKPSTPAQERYQKVFTSTAFRTEHPLVRVHPGTGARSLLLGHFAQRILGVSAGASAHLLALFQEHIARVENTVRWRWKVGDVAMWDNRATQHLAVDDYGDQPRVLRRVTVAGDTPVSIDGRSSIARQAASRANGGVSAEPNYPSA